MTKVFDATEVMLCWTPGTANVALVPWPDVQRASTPYQCSSLACYGEFREMTFEQRKAQIFIEAMTLIIRDECDPSAVHHALCGLNEYRAGCPVDMPDMGEAGRKKP
ncbi:MULTISPECIES: hypothetical protein [Pseudomonas]|jgi:hypothetical protein|uniref:Uncharacterized protein n=1 Tax=Pseudomonas fluorescens TaxID=294 RepID=A0A5E6RKA9_PSEFL|nr:MULTISPECIES: hypothetical protein [Pseudomonas]MCF5725332.1 hypothetical protein [Pseudomonas syringae]VVM69354.1 hypothetical protein PS673_01693 [Pseudomonas fluorescens]